MIEICQSGASFNGGCAICPTGFICEPGKYPRPCPLGQYLSTSKRDFKITWGSKEQVDMLMSDIIVNNVQSDDPWPGFRF